MKTPTSRLYGCFVDYLSPERRQFRAIDPAKEMAWGLGVLLLGLAASQLPKCLNFRDQETKVRAGYMLEMVKMRYGWDLYEIIRGLMDKDRVTCRQLK